MAGYAEVCLRAARLRGSDGLSRLLAACLAPEPAIIVQCARMTPLETELRRMIAADGPISVARYMALCLGHPVHGYYMARDPLGPAGDFVTAPEISQMFGELLGLWAAAVWQQMDAPARALLVELGPGRGTLMADALRAASVVPGFRTAASVHLIETSPALRSRQQETLAPLGVPLAWHDDIAQLPDAPMIVLANEFFDALPVFQAVKTLNGWHERMVGLDRDGRLALALHPQPLPRFDGLLPPELRNARPGELFEWRADREVAELCGRLESFGGAVLAIDYGHAESGFGDTLQAVHRHASADPLGAPGEADLTAHVDFAALARAAGRAGAAVQGPLGLGEFLRRLGIEARAAKLRANATAAQSADVERALARLTGTAPGEMGALFKVLAFANRDLGPLPGFDS
jgi:NADH dehydrogenase [ubiquinone] 1 alpha subcomplex assembly factor 7